LNNIIIVKTFNPEARLTIIEIFDFKAIITTTMELKGSILV
jgi:hypothetical protein